MNSSVTPEGPGSVAAAPSPPGGFAGTFTSRYFDTGGLRQHVVTGGGGPPLVLVHGWLQTWYAWRDRNPFVRNVGRSRPVRASVVSRFREVETYVRRNRDPSVPGGRA